MTICTWMLPLPLCPCNEAGGDIEKLRERYYGHEISCHTVSHGWPDRMPCQSIVKETLENRIYLERIAMYPVQGMSYPFGAYNETVKTAMKMSGIVYSRTVNSSMNFQLPDDFLEWNPSCHHNKALELSEVFMKNLNSRNSGGLFYVWGHSHEFSAEEDWTMMEKLLDIVSGNDKIWYATNIEIYRYIMAQKELAVSADENMFYNPSAIDVWIEKDGKEIICIPAGETVEVSI